MKKKKNLLTAPGEMWNTGHGETKRAVEQITRPKRKWIVTSSSRQDKFTKKLIEALTQSFQSERA